MMWMPRCRFNEWKGITGVTLILIVSSVFMLVGCVPQKVTVTSSPNFKPSVIHKLAILPFQTLSTPQRFLSSSSQSLVESTEIRSQFRLPAPQSSKGRLASVDTVKVSALASKRITRMVYESLEYRPGLRLIPPIEVSNVLTTFESQGSSESWKEKVKEVGKQLNVDAVLVGLVRTYRERVGTKIGATPAAVGFEVHLVDPVSGKVHWTGEYYEEQKPMNEDFIGFVERGGAFVTAGELAEYGVHKMMKEFPIGER